MNLGSKPISRAEQINRESDLLRSFQRKADDICCLIVSSDLPWIDIAIQIEQLRAEAQNLFPLKMSLFELIYIHRFNRLWAQWRSDDTETNGAQF